MGRSHERRPEGERQDEDGNGDDGNGDGDFLGFFESALGSVFDEVPFALGNKGEVVRFTFSTALRSRFAPQPTAQQPAGIKHDPAVETPQQHPTAYATHGPSEPRAHHHHTVTLCLPDTADPGNMPLMASYVWQAAIVAAHLVASAHPAAHVRDARVVELGAGAGLVSVVAGLCGAADVVASDYPDAGIEAALLTNLARGLGSDSRRRSDRYGGRWDVVMHKWGDPATISNLLLATEEDVVAGGGVGVDRPHGSPAPTPTPAPAPTPAPPLLVVMADVLWMPDQHPALLKDLGVLFSSAPGGPSSASAIVASGLHTGRYVIDAFMRSARASGFCVQKLGEVRVGQAGVQAQDDGAFSLFEPGSEAEDVSEERRRLEETSPSERKRWVLVYTLTLANHCK